RGPAHSAVQTTGNAVVEGFSPSRGIPRPVPGGLRWDGEVVGVSTLSLTQARSAYARRDWRAVYEHLHPVREELDAEDLVVLAEAAWWLGDVPASRALAERAFEGLLTAGAVERAAERAQRLALS